MTPYAPVPVDRESVPTFLSTLSGVQVTAVARNPRRVLPPVPEFRVTRTVPASGDAVVVTLRQGARPRFWHVGISGSGQEAFRRVRADLAPAFPRDVVMHGLRAWVQEPGTLYEGVCALGRAWDLAAGMCQPRLTYAQELWTVDDRPPHRGDGRFAFDGCVEPYPGAWPPDAVTAAFDRDPLTRVRFAIPGGDT